RILIAAESVDVDRRKSRAILVGAAVAEVHLRLRLRKEREVVILQMTRGGDGMIAGGDGESLIDVVARAPVHVIAIPAILGDPQADGLRSEEHTSELQS